MEDEGVAMYSRIELCARVLEKMIVKEWFTEEMFVTESTIPRGNGLQAGC